MTPFLTSSFHHFEQKIGVTRTGEIVRMVHSSSSGLSFFFSAHFLDRIHLIKKIKTILISLKTTKPKVYSIIKKSFFSSNNHFFYYCHLFMFSPKWFSWDCVIKLLDKQLFKRRFRELRNNLSPSILI